VKQIPSLQTPLEESQLEPAGHTTSAGQLAQFSPKSKTPLPQFETLHELVSNVLQSEEHFKVPEAKP